LPLAAAPIAARSNLSAVSALVGLAAAIDDLGHVVLADFREILEGVLVLVFRIVVIEAGVSIGAHTTVDRARFGATYVLRGSALDNLIMLGHNVSVGPHTIIIAQTGISGGTKIGAHCVVAGQVGIVGHIEIGDGIMIGAKSSGDELVFTSVMSWSKNCPHCQSMLLSRRRLG